MDGFVKYEEALSQIFAKPAAEWSSDDYNVIKTVQQIKGGRAWLKTLRETVNG